MTSSSDQLERTVETLKAKGVAFERYELPDTARRGDIHVSGEIRNAWFKDPGRQHPRDQQRMIVSP